MLSNLKPKLALPTSLRTRFTDMGFPNYESRTFAYYTSVSCARQLTLCEGSCPRAWYDIIRAKPTDMVILRFDTVSKVSSRLCFDNYTCPRFWERHMASIYITRKRRPKLYKLLPDLCARQSPNPRHGDFAEEAYRRLNSASLITRLDDGCLAVLFLILELVATLGVFRAQLELSEPWPYRKLQKYAEHAHFSHERMTIA